MKIENYIESEVVGAAEDAGWFVRKLAWEGRRDAPDRFFAKNGRVVLIEFKSPTEEPRPAQGKEIDALRQAGVTVHVVDTVGKGLRLLGIAA